MQKQVLLQSQGMDTRVSPNIFFVTLLTLLVMLGCFAPAGAQVVGKFDFGTGGLATGYQRVDATNMYNEQSGFGFDYGTQAVAINRSFYEGKVDPKANALNEDFCTSSGSMFFSMRLPEGTYRVTATLGDPIGSSQTTIKAESRRLMVKEISTAHGQLTKVSFLVHIWDSVIRPGEVVHLKPREIDKLDWDNKLTLEFGNKRPCLSALVIEKVAPEKTITVYLSGNSTVTDQQLEPWACWGQMIPAFFGPEKVAFANMAASGETLRSSVSRKRLDKIAACLKPGDYLFIEFAHNDQKKGSGEIAFGSYNEYLRRYIDTARAHKAIPVLVTSTRRRSFNAQGGLNNTLGDFPAAMRQEAKKQGVVLLDLNEMTKILYLALGPERSKILFVHYPKGSFPGQTSDLADNTHFSNFGGYELAKCLVTAIRAKIKPLAAFILPGTENFDPAKPDDYAHWDLPFSPMFTNIKPYGN